MGSMMTGEKKGPPAGGDTGPAGFRCCDKGLSVETRRRLEANATRPAIARDRRCPGSESNEFSEYGVASPRAATDLASPPGVLRNSIFLWPASALLKSDAAGRRRHLLTEGDRPPWRTYPADHRPSLGWLNRTARSLEGHLSVSRGGACLPVVAGLTARKPEPQASSPTRGGSGPLARWSG
jgi:hypothetical protein